MKKVLGFDSWTAGSINYARLVEAFAARGLELLVVHTGSWGVDAGRPIEEMVGPVRYRDVSFYEGADLAKILEVERPDAVLFLSTRTFSHRAFQRYCRVNGIPTIHLYHGLWRVQDVDNQARPYKPNALSYLRFVLERVGKSLRYTWPAYARSLWRTRASFGEWIRFAIDIVNLSRGYFSVRAADDARTTKCCVYTASDVQHAVTTYGMEPRDVVPVGNPDLMIFGLEPRMMGRMLDRHTSAERTVMYIETAYYAVGAFFRDETEFVEHILGVRQSLEHQEKQLLFKPHPATQERGLDQVLAKQGIEIVEKPELLLRLEACSACIVEPSTLAVIPALMGLPLQLARFGKLRSLVFGPMLVSYPRARHLENIDNFTAVLEAEESACNTDAVWHWIEENSGPLPATDMPRRVAQVVVELVNNSS